MQAKIGRDLLRALAKTPPTNQTDIVDTELRGFMLRWRPSGEHTYMLRTPRGWLALGRTAELKPEKARQLAEVKRGDLAEGRDLLAERRAAKARERAERDVRRLALQRETLTLRKYLTDTYGPWLDARGKTGAETQSRIKAVFADLLDVPLHEFTNWHVERWKTKRNKEGRTPGTINRDLNPLKALFARATEWGHLARHPLNALKPERTDRFAVVRYLSRDEETRLRNALTARDDERRRARDQANAWRQERHRDPWPPLGTYTDHLTPIVLLALNTGLRRGEIFKLRWGAVDWIHRLVTVSGDTAKTATTRHVDLNDEALDVLMTWRTVRFGEKTAPADEVVFPNSEGQPLDNVQSSWEELLKDAEVTRFRFHDLRHTFASKLVQRGVPLQVVAQLLGHASVLMTQRYAHLAPSQTREAVQKLGMN